MKKQQKKYIKNFIKDLNIDLTGLDDFGLEKLSIIIDQTYYQTEKTGVVLHHADVHEYLEKRKNKLISKCQNEIDEMIDDLAKVYVPIYSTIDGNKYKEFREDRPVKVVNVVHVNKGIDIDLGDCDHQIVYGNYAREGELVDNTYEHICEDTGEITKKIDPNQLTERNCLLDGINTALSTLIMNTEGFAFNTQGVINIYVNAYDYGSTSTYLELKEIIDKCAYGNGWVFNLLFTDDLNEFEKMDISEELGFNDRKIKMYEKSN